MIKNLKQYEITQNAANSFRWALKNLSSNDDENLHPSFDKGKKGCCREPVR